MRWRRGRARAEPEEGDDRWSPPLSQARRAVKAAQGEAFPREGVSYPVPRNRERSLHTCAQDVQITRMATI
jgi:hypothetical protein